MLECSSTIYQTSFCTSLGFTPFHLVYDQEALFLIKLELASLKVIARNKLKPKEKVKKRVFHMELLQNDQEKAVEYYKAKVDKRREKFNKWLTLKDLQEEHLRLRYDSCHDHKKDGKSQIRWEGPFQVLHKLSNNSF